MNANVILVIGLVLIVVAILAFILLVLLPGRGEKEVLFRGWLVTDHDGYSYLCTKRPWRQTWIDSEGHVHGMWWNDDASFIELTDVLSSGALSLVGGLPRWEDEPVRVSVTLDRDLYDEPVFSYLQEDNNGIDI